MEQTEGQHPRTEDDRRRVRRGGRRISDLVTHDEAFVTPMQFAVHLGVDRRQVMKWINAGSLIAYRFDDRQWRIRLEDARAFVERSRFQLQQTPPATVTPTQ
jgi:excisionase family DNA binding protein